MPSVPPRAHEVPRVEPDGGPLLPCHVLRALDCRVIRLAELVDWRLGRGPAPPPRAVVITADDGHRSQVEVMAPRLAPRGWHATLFVHPSAVSNASYAVR